MSCADVCLSHDWDGSTDFHSSRTVKARKPHKCCECGRAICVGESHQYVSGKCEGWFFTERTCAECEEIRTVFVCGSWVYGELWESMREQMFPMWRTKGAWDCLAKLTTEAAVAKCNAEYREWCTDNEYDETNNSPEAASRDE
jgi:hypothetical protein